MGMSQRPHDDLDGCSEINLTPFIDVILVLLIIFMIAAQASTVSQSVDLPSSRAQAKVPPERPTVFALQADGSYSVNDRRTDANAVGAALRAAGARAEDRILLTADRSLRYEDIMEGLDRLQQAGFTHVGLVAREHISP